MTVAFVIAVVLLVIFMLRTIKLEEAKHLDQRVIDDLKKGNDLLSMKLVELRKLIR